MLYGVDRATADAETIVWPQVVCAVRGNIRDLSE